MLHFFLADNITFIPAKDGQLDLFRIQLDAHQTEDLTVADFLVMAKLEDNFSHKGITLHRNMPNDDRHYLQYLPIADGNKPAAWHTTIAASAIPRRTTTPWYHKVILSDARREQIEERRAEVRLARRTKGPGAFTV